MWALTYPITLYILRLIFFLYFQGLNSFELVAHPKEEAAQLRHEGIG